MAADPVTKTPRKRRVPVSDVPNQSAHPGDTTEKDGTDLIHVSRAAMLGELAAALAHELNQPLTAILTNAQATQRFLSRGGIEPEELHSILNDIVRDAKRAGGVIQNLRAMLRNEPVPRENCCINAVVREVAELMHAELVGRHIELCMSLADPLTETYAARVEMQQVLINLLLNAMQAMKGTPPAERIIEIETRTDANTVTLSVRDHGCGIPPDKLNAIFTPFYTTKPTGLGMGLAICRRLIEMHSGAINASNHISGGAVVSFSLPTTQDRT